MVLRADEIRPGIVAYFDAALLFMDPAMTITNATAGGSDIKWRPFVCVESAGGYSYWSPLTSAPRPERLPLWQLVEVGKEKLQHLFLMDGASIFMAPHDSFVLASAIEVDLEDRPRLTGQGLTIVRAEVLRQRPRRIVRKRGGQV